MLVTSAACSITQGAFRGRAAGWGWGCPRGRYVGIEIGQVPVPVIAPCSRALDAVCGFALANKGHDTRALQAYLGHRNIQHTVRYTELSPGRFKDFFR